MDLPGLLFGMQQESFRSEQGFHGIDHVGIATEENVGVGRIWCESPDLIQVPLSPEILKPPRMAFPMEQARQWVG